MVRSVCGSVVTATKAHGSLRDDVCRIYSSGCIDAWDQDRTAVSRKVTNDTRQSSSEGETTVKGRQ